MSWTNAWSGAWIIIPEPLLKSRPHFWERKAPLPAAEDTTVWSRPWAGPNIPAIGFAIGVDRLAEIAARNHPDLSRKPKLFIAALGETSQTLAFEWVSRLAAAGIHAEMDMADRSLKSQMKQADRLGAGHVLIAGDSELEKGQVLLRNMATKEQVPVLVKDLVEEMRNRFA